jgi:hypothetical protein
LRAIQERKEPGNLVHQHLKCGIARSLSLASCKNLIKAYRNHDAFPHYFNQKALLDFERYDSIYRERFVRISDIENGAEGDLTLAKELAERMSIIRLKSQISLLAVVD